MNPRHALRLGAFFGLLGVALGAFGAHALKTRVGEYELQIFETGVRYQMYHALALLTVGLVDRVGRRSRRGLAVATAGFAVGILIFSGSLYALALSGEKWLGAITPIGGLAFLVGWAALMISAGDGSNPVGSSPSELP